MRLRWLRGRISAAILIGALVVTASCSKSNYERRIEIWVSSKDRPQIRAYANEWWAYGSDLRIFNAKLGPSIGVIHTHLEGDLGWVDSAKGEAVFTYELENKHPIAVTILGVTESETAAPTDEPKLMVVYQPGKHTFKKTLWVKYTYD